MDVPHVMGDENLFGHDPMEGIVAVEPAGDGAVDVFRRDPVSCELEVLRDAFRPFLWVCEAAFLQGFDGVMEIEELEGSLPLRYLAHFPDWRTHERAVRYLTQVTGYTPGRADAPYMVLRDPVLQYLIQTGRTCFKGLPFSRLHRLQLDIETYTEPGFDFPNPEREGDGILLVAMSDSSGWAETRDLTQMTEPELIRWIGNVIEERDPDVIEGHNLFKFDLDFIYTRARRFGVKLRWGRGRRPISRRSSRWTVADRAIQYPRFDLYGRTVIDTLFLLQAYDVAARNLEGFGLKQAAKHFGFAAEDREYVEPHAIQGLIDTDPERLRRYALDDVLETRQLSEQLSGSYYVQAQMLPYSYQNIAVRGNAAKIDALLMRAYYRRRHSMSLPEVGRAFAGGYTDIFYEGVARPIAHCDVQSLYPSVMLAFGMLPGRDDLGVFRTLLESLRSYRLDAKAQARAAEGAQAWYLQALQGTFKILINSFYGYLGFSQALFNDFDQAERITAKGREILRGMVDWLRQHGATVIEIDTDGIYFVPPAFEGDEARKAFEQGLEDSLPEGIGVEFDASYQAMFSYKMKNYALLDEAGRILIRGAALRSRGLEPYQRDFLRDLIRLILEGGSVTNGDALMDRYRERIESGEMPIEELAKSERLQDSLETYRTKLAKSSRARNAAYELALASGRPYEAGDTVSYYVTGDKKRVAVVDSSRLMHEWDAENRDENIPYYVNKLEQTYKKYRGFLGAPLVPVKPGADAKKKGFTLIEILIVVTILGILLSLVSVRLVGQRSRARVQAAELQIATLVGALELYHDRMGDYPRQSQGLEVLIEPPAIPGQGGVRPEPFLTGRRALVDPWGRPYLYFSPGADGRAFEVMTYGRDGRSGGAGEDADLSSIDL
jgi:type II secretion system protein G